MDTSGELHKRLAALEERFDRLENSIQQQLAFLGHNPLGAYSAQTTYVTFALGEKIFALPLDSVSEIIRLVEIHPATGATDAVEGLVNVRGKLVPIVNFRRQLGLEEPAQINLSEHILFCNLGDIYFGFRVDSVRGIISVSTDDIQLPLDSPLHKSLVFGTISRDSTLYSLVDPRFILEEHDKDAIAQLHAEKMTNYQT